ncbi:hypothetical protein CGZ90_15090 [Fictibacillus aquaticus]|uniref:Uncharacterized protein n=1 Tax=Fictibacillus aquaticus TaxID=2021314 RepID=A0A235F6P7_9BACL|nr:hypothetical protein CGZ90_15090 [Fictibacillus aquaticus]
MFEKIFVLCCILAVLYWDYKKAKQNSSAKKYHLILCVGAFYLGFLYFTDNSRYNLDDFFKQLLGPAAQYVNAYFQS